MIQTWKIVYNMRIQEPAKYPNGELNVSETSTKFDKKESTIKVEKRPLLFKIESSIYSSRFLLGLAGYFSLLRYF